jgi:hypothetical protein
MSTVWHGEGGGGITAHIFILGARIEMSSQLRRFNPRETAPDIHCMEGCVGLGRAYHCREFLGVHFFFCWRTQNLNRNIYVVYLHWCHD